MPEPTVFSGRYELHRRLGRGGMAEVFLARDLQLDRPVAVKVLFPEFATDPAFVARFKREAQAAANLNHPNIVGVYDWGQEHGTYFIVMEYVDGHSVAELIRDRGVLEPNRAADIATDVAAALAHAHKGGMLHRDIKPGNILVTNSGLVKVADWGIGRALDAAAEENLTQTGAVMGTATYFSPEQAQGLALDPRSDLYSLGVVLYECLTGKPPFQGDSPVAIAYKHVQEQPQPPRSRNMDVPEDLEAIVLRLLEKDPAFRYATADDVRADLRRYREGFRVLATQAPAPATEALAGTTVQPQVSATRAVVGVPVEDVPREYLPPPEKRSWGFLVALILLLGVLVVLLFFLAQTLGITGGEDEPEVVQVEVPRVVGLTEEAARDLLLAPNCQETDPATEQVTQVACFVVGETEFVDVEDPAQTGLVISQDPENGRRVDQGSTVTLSVGSQETILVPDVAGSLPDDAVRLLEAEGFTGPFNERDEASENVPEGQVIRTEPAADTSAPPDASFTLFVSSGPPSEAVPDCVGATADQCAQRLTDAGFTSTRTSQESSTVPEGQVIGTNPSGEAPAGSQVTIIVSSGPSTETVPSVVNLTQATAEAAIRDAGFRVAVEFETVAASSPSVGKVIRQTPAGNSEQSLGSTVTIVVGVPADDPTTTSAPDVGD